ncbi:enoyl-CoA hydratase/isomerase family protein [Rhodoblastus sp.]|uniref:enoyl-CoA hydratase/isomerase family protein n=1 Tax=Rhodoblastus sp. TaxID=1962975 RepID=UPI0035B154B9
MAFANVEIERAGGIVTLWMNRPERRNAFNAELIAELTEALGEAESDDQSRVVVLAGRGASFCAGADLGWMKAYAEAEPEKNLDDARRLAALLRKLADLRKPTIARVHGAAIGGGMGLAAACDICVASTDAFFATSEVRIGLIPAVIGPYVLRAIGARQASRYLLTGERIDAAAARELGLVHELAAAEAIDAKVGEIAAALSQGGPEALASAKLLLREIAHRPLDDALSEDMARRIATIRAGAEAGEGISAFLEKRTPGWRA